MAYQSASNAYVAYHVQSGLGTQYTSTGATVLRQTGGAGLKETKANTPSTEVRADMMHSLGRHGTQKVTGQWSGEASCGSYDDVYEAVMRGTWATALTTTQSDFTSLTTTTSTIVLTSGNPITLGYRVNDVIRLSGLATTANNSKNLRITGLSATTITVAETLVLDATPDTTCSIVRYGKKLINPPAASLVKRYYTIEEYEADIDLSEVATDFVFGSVKFSMGTNGLLMVDVGGVGTGQFAAQSTGTSPLLVSPTTGTAVPFAVVDATIRLQGVDVVDLTSFDISMDNGPTAPDVFGSGSIKYSPDVFPGQMAVSLNITALRKDLALLSAHLAETVYSIHILAVENESEPKDFLSINIPYFTIGEVNKSALSDKGGARTQTLSVPTALVGQDITGTGYDATMIKIQSSAA